MANRTISVADRFTVATNGGGETITGTLAFDRFDPLDGVLLAVSYRVDLLVRTAGGIAGDGATPFGSANTVFGLDLDPGDDDGVAVDAFADLSGGQPAIPLAGRSTPVVYAVRDGSGPIAVAPSAQGAFVGRADLVVGFEGFSGVTAFGSPFVGPQGAAFTNENTAAVTISYTFREAIAGGPRPNALAGTALADVILGGAGADRIDGGAGSDRLYGQADGDVIRGGAGGDVVEGWAGNDVLTGGLGDDRIVGGQGHDVMAGGAGADRFAFERGSGADRVLDLGDADLIDLRGYGNLDLGDLRLVAIPGGTRLVIAEMATVALDGVTRAELTADAFLF